MTGDKSRLKDVNAFNGGSVKFDNNYGAKIVGKGSVSLNNGKIQSSNVLYVDGLKHSLLSVSQLCKEGNHVVFTNKGSIIKSIQTEKQVGQGKRTSDNLYILAEKSSEECMLSQEDESKLWHKRLGHKCDNNLSKLNKKEGVRDLPQLKRLREAVCASCQKGKQAIRVYKVKEHHANKTLELVHTDLCGPMRNKATGGEYYMMLFIDDFTRLTCVNFLKKKDETVDCFRRYRKQMENSIGRRIKSI